MGVIEMVLLRLDRCLLHPPPLVWIYAVRGSPGLRFFCPGRTSKAV